MNTWRTTTILVKGSLWRTFGASFLLAVLLFAISAPPTFSQQPPGANENEQADELGACMVNLGLGLRAPLKLTNGECLAQMMSAALVGLTGFVYQLISVAADAFGVALEWADRPPTGVTSGVEKGWGYSLDLANMFFIAVLIFIALMTILDIESYGFQRLLPKLIIIALVINFSLFFTQQIIGAFNSMALFILQGTSLPEQGCSEGSATVKAICAFKEKIGKVLALNKFVEPNPAPDYGPGAGDLIFSALAASLNNFILGIVILFTLLAGTLFAVGRNVILWFLTAVAPLAFLTWIWGGSTWNRWWSALIKWCLFMPTYIFFLTLAVNIFEGMNIDFAATMPANATLTSQSGGYLVQLAVAVMALFGCLGIATSTGAFGANRIMGWAKTGGNMIAGGATKLAGKAAWQVTGRPITAAGAKVGKMAGAAAAGEGRIATTLRNIPFVGKLANRAASRYTAKEGEAVGKQIEEKKKLNANVLEDDVRRLRREGAYIDPTSKKARELAASTAALKEKSPERAAAVMRENPQATAQAITYLNTTGKTKEANDLAKTNPELYGQHVRQRGEGNDETERRLHSETRANQLGLVDTANGVINPGTRNFQFLMETLTRNKMNEMPAENPEMFRQLIHSIDALASSMTRAQFETLHNNNRDLASWIEGDGHTRYGLHFA